MLTGAVCEAGSPAIKSPRGEAPAGKTRFAPRTIRCARAVKRRGISVGGHLVKTADTMGAFGAVDAGDGGAPGCRAPVEPAGVRTP